MQKDNYEDLIWSLDIDAILEEHRSKMLASMAKQIRRYLSDGVVLVEGRPGYGRRVELSETNIAQYFDDYHGSGIFEQILMSALRTGYNLDRYLALKVCDYVPEMDRQRISKRDLKDRKSVV